jgi:excisionase family DNA binding protein
MSDDRDDLTGDDLKTVPLDAVLLRPSEVANLFHVNPRTVTRWARTGKLTTIRTVGGHRRYRLSEVLAIRDRERQQG